MKSFFVKIIANVITIFVIAVTGVHAQEIERAGQVDAIKQSVFERDLENNISSALRLQLGSIPFLVQVSAELRSIKTYAIDTVSIYQPSSVEAPSLESKKTIVRQQLQEVDAGRTNQNIDPVDDGGQSISNALPGAPILLTNSDDGSEQNQPRRNQPITEVIQSIEPISEASESQPRSVGRFVNTTRETFIESHVLIDRIDVKLWLPSDLEPSRIRFLKHLVSEKARINLIRGDQFTTILTNFPETEKKEDTLTTNQNSSAESINIDNIGRRIGLDRVVSELSQNNWLPWALAGLLFLWLLFLLFRKKRTAHHQPPIATYHHSDVPFSPPSLTNINPSEPASLEDKQQDHEHKQRLKILNEDIVSNIMLHEGLLLNALNNPNLAIEKVRFTAWLIKLLGTAVVAKYAYDQLNESELKNANALQEVIEQSTLIEQCEWAAKVHRSLRDSESLSNKNISQPFDFLNEMNDQKLKRLLNEEHVQAKALILSQIDQRRSAAILAMFSAEEQASIAIAMGKLTTLPVSSFHDIANQLARKAQSIPEVNELNIDGTEALVQMIESMDLANGTAFLNELRKQNPDQYYRIKKLYMGFEDIPKIPKAILKNFLREIEREELVTALYDEEDAFREQLLSALPDRAKALVQQLLSETQTPTAAKIMQSKKMISTKARQLLRAKVFELPTDEETFTASSTSEAGLQEESIVPSIEVESRISEESNTGSGSSSNLNNLEK